MNPAKFSFRFILPVALALIAMSLATNAFAQDKKPNILFIMGDDIGWMQPSLLSSRLDGRGNTEH